jgi:ankyrin repeat protein
VLHLAAQNGHIEVVRFLLAYGVNPHATEAVSFNTFALEIECINNDRNLRATKLPLILLYLEENLKRLSCSWQLAQTSRDARM